jgi:hypothetical protein
MMRTHHTLMTGTNAVCGPHLAVCTTHAHASGCILFFPLEWSAMHSSPSPFALLAPFLSSRTCTQSTPLHVISRIAGSFMWLICLSFMWLLCSVLCCIVCVRLSVILSCLRSKFSSTHSDVAAQLRPSTYSRTIHNSFVDDYSFPSPAFLSFPLPSFADSVLLNLHPAFDPSSVEGTTGDGDSGNLHPSPRFLPCLSLVPCLPSPWGPAPTYRRSCSRCCVRRMHQLPSRTSVPSVRRLYTGTN